MNTSEHDDRPAGFSASNPYAPALPVEERAESGSHPGLVSNDGRPVPRSLAKLWIRWTLVCGIAASPSFFIAYSAKQHPPLAMALGILCFIIAYVWLDHFTFQKAWRHQNFIRRMLVFIYGTRVVITLIYPIGFIVDMAMGLFSYYIVGMATGSTANDIEKSIPDFYTTFLLTIVQGTLLNLVLAVWGMLCAVIALSFLFLIRRF